MSGSISDVLNGVATLLDANSIGVYETTGTYASTDWAITLDLIPPAPDNCITIRAYVLSADPYPVASGLIGLQFVVRSLSRSNERDKQDAIFQLLHAREDDTFGSVHVALTQWRSAVPLGLDDNFRSESTSNYSLMVDYPPTSNRPD